ncbi:MAG: hypothetical protein ACD_80C00131G0011 [uncultured bacterium (gcode 4)]|uniref:Uncharacterized protein n=1 Tax=uncultured bacterium (gcode 4) TaxID=1234023 RepID=K1XX89_9BACT|nr:MAG: hypothetical protein ACD_80C00131G0011 [uncultured bacterium (gcode 4)]
MAHRVETPKWILYRHTSDFWLICKVAGFLKYECKSSISIEEKMNLLHKLQEAGLYNERNPELPLDSINHRINTLANYMFWYKDVLFWENKFLFSPLWNLFLKHINDFWKLSKIFLTMLRWMQYEHPHWGSDPIFQLYPFRLIFKLLTDARIDSKLFVSEVAYLIVFMQSIDNASYEKLVTEIIKFRKKSNEEIAHLFRENEHVYVNAVYEWDYYTSKVLKSAGIVIKNEWETICKLKHGKSTYRTLKNNSVELNSNVRDYCFKLLEESPYTAEPLKLNDPQRLKIDVIKEIYSYYPTALLREIKEENLEVENILQLPKLIEQYSNNNEWEEAYLFEKVLTEWFNMFYNVEAKLIWWAGKTDIECLYLTKNKKFAVDAKSTQNKLSWINAWRLNRHRQLIWWEYTIVITPRYVPSVKYDIIWTQIVLVLASTFAEYLYNHINQENHKIDYEDFDSIITWNLWTDISSYISNLTLSKFWVG